MVIELGPWFFIQKGPPFVRDEDCAGGDARSLQA
jgi:hypothetical protein